MRCDSCYKKKEEHELHRITHGCCHEKTEDYYCDPCYDAYINRFNNK